MLFKLQIRVNTTGWKKHSRFSLEYLNTNVYVEHTCSC